MPTVIVLAKTRFKTSSKLTTVEIGRIAPRRVLIEIK